MTPITFMKLINSGWRSNFVGFPSIWRKGALRCLDPVVRNENTGVYSTAFSMEDLKAAERNLK